MLNYLIVVVFFKFGVALVASQRSLLRKIIFFNVCSVSSICFAYFELKKTRLDFWRRSVDASTRELRSEATSYIFGWGTYQNNPRLSSSLHDSSLCDDPRSKFCIIIGEMHQFNQIELPQSLLIALFFTLEIWGWELVKPHKLLYLGFYTCI